MCGRWLLVTWCCLAVVVAACGDNSNGGGDPDAFTVGGTTSGLAGQGLVLRNNGGDALAISADGGFVFATPLVAGAAYDVTVATQPSDPTQQCTVANGSGTVGNAPVTDIAVTCTTSAFTIGGTVTGLAGSGLVVENNATDPVTIAADGTFAFTKPLPSGTAFAVTIATQPSGPTQTCTVAGGNGIVGDGDVTSVVINCATDKFTVGGLVAGLEGTVVLRNNGGDDVTLTANGSFAFATTVASGQPYAVTVFANPTSPSQTCVVTDGTGTVADQAVTSVRVLCTTNTFTVGGTVSGLAGTGLVLQNNGGDNLAIGADGSFTFATPIASGGSYAVTVLAQPTSPTQVCTVTAGTGTVTSANVTSVAVTCATSAFTVGGTVSGLVGTGLVLQNNGGDDLPIAADGAFTFTTPVASGATFTVTVLAQPTSPSQTCVVSGGTGTVGTGNTTSVAVNCATNTYTIGGTVSGLAGTVVLQNNNGDDLALTGNGDFAFATPIASGGSYAVTVATQPSSPTQTCTISGGSGTVGATDVTSVVVTCVTSTFTVGGTVAGLAGSGLVLRNNGGDDLAIATNGTFAFSTPVASGAPYAVTVLDQPTGPSQTCVVASGSGVVGGSNVEGVTVTCTTDTFVVGGTVSGLAGTGLVLQNEGGDDLAVTANGTFEFPTRVPSGGTYEVTVLAQPTSPWQTCVVSAGSGNVTNQDIASVVVSCTTNELTIGGTVTGLDGTGLVLQNNGGDDLAISADGDFTFATPIASGTTYNVTVLAHPANPTQTCVVAGGSGTVAGAPVTSVTVNCTVDRFTVGGSISGLAGSGLVLRNNGGDDLAVGANGTFAFATPVASGQPYSVTIASQPTSPWQTCMLAGASGTVTNGPVTSIVVTCTTDRFTVGGTISGLASGASVVLRNNGADDLPVSANGIFTFAVPIASGAPYAVTVQTQPALQECTVTAGSGTVQGTDVTDVIVTCVDLPACGVTFVNETAARGLPTNARGTGVVWFDIEGDGDQDLFVRSVGLFVNDGTGTFTNETAARGITGVGASIGSPTSVGDFDSDNDLDLFVGNDSRNTTSQNHLYRNDGAGNFSDVASAAGLVLSQNTPRATTFIDHDVDGDVDLLYSSEFNAAAMYRNDGALPFANDSSKFSTHLQGDGAAWADPDEDGDFDLFLATGSGADLNRFFRDGGSTWTDVASSVGLAGPAQSWRWGGATWVDLDLDGDLDLHVIANSGTDLVHHQQPNGTFVESVATAIGLPDSSGFLMAAMWADFDRDGDLDALIPDRGLYRNDGTGQFALVASSGIAAGTTAAWADIDNDGVLDLYVAHLSSGDRLYRGVATTASCVPQRAMRIRAVTDRDGNATDANVDDDRDALGARVEIDLDGDGDFAGRVTSYLIGAAQSGNHAQSALAPTIGTGSATVVDVRVTFADGSVVTLLDTPVVASMIVRDP